MEKVTQQNVLDALADFKDPESGRGVVQMEQVRDIRVDGSALSFTLALTTHSALIWDETREAAAQLVRAKLPQLTEVTVGAAVHERKPMKLGQVGLTAKSVIAVGSGKGGVGKSTIAASLAGEKGEQPPN